VSTNQKALETRQTREELRSQREPSPNELLTAALLDEQIMELAGIGLSPESVACKVIRPVKFVIARIQYHRRNAETRTKLLVEDHREIEMTRLDRTYNAIDPIVQGEVTDIHVSRDGSVTDVPADLTTRISAARAAVGVTTARSKLTGTQQQPVNSTRIGIRVVLDDLCVDTIVDVEGRSAE
jgi:hypothetical protein